MAEQAEGPKKYKVTGPAEVLGHAPGSVFEADLSEEQERTLTEGGHIARATGNVKVADSDSVSTPAARAREMAEANVPVTAEEAAALEPVEPVAPDEEEGK